MLLVVIVYYIHILYSLMFLINYIHDYIQYLDSNLLWIY